MNVDRFRHLLAHRGPWNQENRSKRISLVPCSLAGDSPYHICSSALALAENGLAGTAVCGGNCDRAGSGSNAYGGWIVAVHLGTADTGRLLERQGCAESGSSVDPARAILASAASDIFRRAARGAGTALAIGEWREVIALALLGANYFVKAKREDRILASRFGEKFAEYKRQAGFLAPKW